MRFAPRHLAVLLLAAGCDCGGGDDIGKLAPKIELEPASLAFGEVPVGATRHQAITVTNRGGAELVLAAADVAEPFAVALAEARVPPGGRGTIDVAFRPTGEDPVSATLVLMSNVEESPMSTIALTGVGVAGFVDVRPREIDLAGTVVGTARTVEIELTNSGIEMVGGGLLTERFARAESFSLTGVARFGGEGTYAVPPRGTVELELAYAPLAPGTDDGRILFETCGERCGVEVVVVANAVQAALRVEPPAIDFGAVGIGASKSETVTVINDGDDGVTVTRVEVAGAGLSNAPAVAVPLSIGPKSNAVVNLEFAPRTAGPIMGQLVLETTDVALARAVVRVAGRGEGPRFVVEPAAIDFGIQRTTAGVRRGLLLANEGSADVEVRGLSIAGDPALALDAVPGLPIRLGGGESALVYVRFGPSAAGMSAATVLVETNDGASPRVEVPVRASYAERSCELGFEPTRLNFGLLPAGLSRATSVRVRNTGNAACTITSGSFASPVDPAFSIDAAPWPRALPPGDMLSLSFRYAPADVRRAKATYVLSTDDLAVPQAPIGLVGSSEAYTDLFVLPTSVDFGQARPGCSAGTREITLFNAGTVPATVEQAVLTSTTPEFSVPLSPGPRFVAPGASAQFPVSYRVADFGRDSAQLELRVTDRPFPIVVPLFGEGVRMPQAVDVFNQVANRAVDVLFVIDDSCSMFDEQQALAANFASFIRTANLRNVDFQLGVTTTDMAFGPRGDLVGPVISRRTAGYEQEFQAQAMRGTRGSAFEQGLEAMITALNKAQQGLGLNRGLLRPGAAFVGIVISDEDDQSPATAVTYFSGLRSLVSNFTTAVVSGQRSGCSSSGRGRAVPAPKYEEFARLTGGVSESICAPSWAQTLSSIGSVAFGLRLRFPLSQPADTSLPIVVRVGGNAVPNTAWTYDAVNEAILFNAANAPPESSIIEITYTPRC